jgi:arylformamidase
MRVVDLTFPIKPHFRWKVATELRNSHSKGDLFQTTILTVHCHAFTHVDAPLHFLSGGRHIAEMPLDQWIGEAAVVDLTHVSENGEVAAADLDWLIRRKVKAVGYDYPPDYCVRTMILEPQKKVAREDNTTHQAFFPAGITVIEYLTNLDRVEASRCQFVALPLPIEGADGSPVRAVAIVD